MGDSDILELLFLAGEAIWNVGEVLAYSGINIREIENLGLES